MIFWITVILANLIVGACVGLTGVAGFLLPIVYTGVLKLGVTESLALSFSAFIVSGIIGAINYHKSGNMDLPFGIRLSIGSLLGAVLGVRMNLLIPESTVKTILYVVVLISGISILLRKDKADNQNIKKYDISENFIKTVALGFITGAICAMSGAGGPVLVMPLLVVFGINIRVAVGVALFNSIFIGLPACIGYMTQSSLKDIFTIMPVALIFHAVGVIFGSKNAVMINQNILKKGIAIFSIIIAIWRLFL